MGIFYYPDRSVPSTTLNLPTLESYESERPEQKYQSLNMTPGGSPIVYDLADPIQYVLLKIRLLSNTDKANLLTFIKTTVNWASASFDYTDDQSVQYNTCRFWFNDLNFIQTLYQKYNEDLLIITGV